MVFYISAVVKHPELSADVAEGHDLIGLIKLSEEDARRKLYLRDRIKNLEHEFMQRYPEPKASEQNEKWDKKFYQFYFMNTRVLYEAYAELKGERYEYFVPAEMHYVGQILYAIPQDAVSVVVSKE